MDLKINNLQNFRYMPLSLRRSYVQTFKGTDNDSFEKNTKFSIC